MRGGQIVGLRPRRVPITRLAHQFSDAPSLTICNLFLFWCPGAELNHRHRDFQSRALPTELPGRRARRAAGDGRARAVYRGSIPHCPDNRRARTKSRPWTRAQDCAGRQPAAVRRSPSRGRRRSVLFLVLGGRDRVDAAEPAVEIDIGAALAAERPECLHPRPCRRSGIAWRRGCRRARSSCGYEHALRPPCKQRPSHRALSQPKRIG